MTDKIDIHDIHDKNLNFLLGSGASIEIAPTLKLGVKDADEEPYTLESLATIFEEAENKKSRAALLMHYYMKCVEPVLKLDTTFEDLSGQLDGYVNLLKSILRILARQPSGERRCNIFTTNYDPCITHAADSLQKDGEWQFQLNDGARGIHRRYVHVGNFNSFLYQSGVFERDRVEVPQINLMHVHGSTFWFKDGDSTYVDTSTDNAGRIIENPGFAKIETFSEILLNEESVLEDLPIPDLSDEEINDFYSDYYPLPIVNPTKWKFHETVFEELYYQLLRHLSYELEKPNAVLVTFGFSFADEHILNIVKRSLINPRLKVYVGCFDEAEHAVMEERFKGFTNVELILCEKPLTFSAFNEEVFCVQPPEHPETE